MFYANDEKRKRTNNRRKELLYQERIKTLGEKETYKYLGILEVDTIKQVKMKEKLKKRLRRTREHLETKFCSKNLIKGIITCNVSLVIRYSEPFLKWTREEIQQMNKRTRKLLWKLVRNNNNYYYYNSVKGV